MNKRRNTMKKCQTLVVILIGFASLSFAETNALIEVQFFKTWVIKGELNFGNLAIKNTGEEPVLLAQDPFHFEEGQLLTRSLPRDPYEDSMKEKEYQRMIRGGDKLFSLLSGESYVYEGRKFYLTRRSDFAEKMRFTVSVYLGNGVWLDSEPQTVYGVVPDSKEHLTTITDVNGKYNLVAVTYKNERWLYKTMTDRLSRNAEEIYFPVCPLNTTNKIRVEPYDNKEQFRIWDGDKFMIFHMTKSVLTEGPDENNVLGKWTRERKQRAEADNAEVRRKKAEAQTQ